MTKSFHSQICFNIYYLQKFIWMKNWIYTTIFSQKEISKSMQGKTPLNWIEPILSFPKEENVLIFRVFPTGGMGEVPPPAKNLPILPQLENLEKLPPDVDSPPPNFYSPTK